MNLIVNLEGAEYLKALGRIKQSARDFLKKTNLIAIRNRKPIYAEKDTEIEKMQKAKEQSNKNIDDMIDMLLTDFPAETYDFIKLFCVFDEGEEAEIKGTDAIILLLQILTDSNTMDFLFLLTKLG